MDSLMPMDGAVLRPDAARRRLSPCPAHAMSAQKAPITEERHEEHKQTKPDLHPTCESGWIDHPDHVVFDESAAVARLSGAYP